MDFYNSMDDETAALILQIQLQEANELFQAANTHTENAEWSDSQIAINTFRRELECNYTIVRDRVMTKSIAQACRLDGAELANLQLDGHAEEDDEDHHTFDFDEGTEFGDLEIDYGLDENLSETEDVFNANFGSKRNMDRTRSYSLELIDQPESSIWKPDLNNDETTYGNCTACNEEFDSHVLAHCPCDHDYCRECLTDLFNASMIDDGLFPPKCCKEPIPPANVHMFLTPEIIRRFDAKKLEIETVDRTYCSSQVCSIFIPPENILGDQARCPVCSTISCAICKAAAHVGDCPADTELQNVLDLAKDNGWQRCFNCRRVIELEIGCNHMTCLCGTQFCYVCAARWKTCACPQWDEGLLLARANVIVARQPGNELEEENQVAAVVENLRLRHNCDHEEWRWIRGRHDCEGCFHTLPSYIFECLQCLVRVCNRCRRSRD